MGEFPNFVEILRKHFEDSGFDEKISLLSTGALLSTMSPDFKVEAFTYRAGDNEIRFVDYPLNLYYVLGGKAGKGKSTLLDKMLNIYLSVSPLTDNVVSARSSSMGIFKNLSDDWNYTLVNGDDADWLLDPELKDGSINEALLKLWNRNYLEHLVQSKEFTQTKRTTFNAWIGVHGFKDINKEQIKNGLARRLLVYIFSDDDNKKLNFVKGSKKKNLSEKLNPKIEAKMRDFLTKIIKPDLKKNPEDYEDYRIYINDEKTEQYMINVFYRVEEYVSKKPSFLDQVIRTYPEILQRFSATLSLWDGTMIVKEDDHYINLGRAVSIETLKMADKILWDCMISYYDDLETAKLGKIDYKVEDLTDNVMEISDFVKRSGEGSGKNFYCPVWKIRRNYVIDVDRLKKVIQTGVSSDKLYLMISKSSNGKIAFYVGIGDKNILVSKMATAGLKGVKFIDYNLIEDLAI